jgi:Golgi SNAP receptor complex protein 2
MYQQKKERREIEISEREQLLSRRFQPNSETTIDLDYSLQHNSKMLDAHRGVDEMLYTG